MSIDGRIKFLSRSKCLVQDETTITASTGTDAAERCLDRNPITYWRSVGSLDVTTETLEIIFNGSQTFDRLFLLDHNWKEYNVQYWNGAAYTHFANVTGIGGSQANVSETVYARDTSYYEFDEVTSTKIRIQVTKTHVVDAQKYVSQVVVCSELGTLGGHPEIKDTQLSRNLRTEKMLSGRMLTMKSDEFFTVSLDFKDYPASLGDDVDLMFSLHDSEETFQIWICGGREGTPYFKKQMRGYRLRDLVTVQMIDDLKPIYSKNVFNNQVNFSAKFQESVD